MVGDEYVAAYQHAVAYLDAVGYADVYPEVERYIVADQQHRLVVKHVETFDAQARTRVEALAQVDVLRSHQVGGPFEEASFGCGRAVSGAIRCEQVGPHSYLLGGHYGPEP